MATACPPTLHRAAVQVNISQRSFLAVCSTCSEASLCSGEWKAAPGEVVKQGGFVCELCEGPRKKIAERHPLALGFDVSKKQLSPNITEFDKVVITPHDEKQAVEKPFWKVAKALNWREKLFLARVNFNNRTQRFTRGGGELAFGKDCWFGKRDLSKMLKDVWALLPRKGEILPPDHAAHSVEFKADLVYPQKNSSEQKRYSIRPYYIKAVAEYLAERCPVWYDADHELGRLQVPDDQQLGLKFDRLKTGSVVLPALEPLGTPHSNITLLQTCAFPLVDFTGLEDVTVLRAGLSAAAEEEEKVDEDAPRPKKTSYAQSLRNNATHLVRRVDLIDGLISFRCQADPAIFAFLRFMLREKELGHCTSKVVVDLLMKHDIRTLRQLKLFLFDRNEKPKEDNF